MEILKAIRKFLGIAKKVICWKNLSFEEEKYLLDKCLPFVMFLSACVVFPCSLIAILMNTETAYKADSLERRIDRLTEEVYRDSDAVGIQSAPVLSPAFPVHSDGYQCE